VRTAVAGALAEAKAYEVAEEGVRFGLEPQNYNEDPWASKFRYVEKKLKGLGLDELVALGHRVLQEYPTPDLEHILALAGARGVAGELKNLIFAADGPKPRIVLRDAVNNQIEITQNAEHCLVYDRVLPPEGLTLRALVAWWTNTEVVPADAEREAATALYRRLVASLAGNGAEMFPRQRMDFLLLLPGRRRIVLELDNVQH
jgi:hypothetical protein